MTWIIYMDVGAGGYKEHVAPQFSKTWTKCPFSCSLVVVLESFENALHCFTPQKKCSISFPETLPRCHSIYVPPSHFSNASYVPDHTLLLYLCIPSIPLLSGTKREPFGWGCKVELTWVYLGSKLFYCHWSLLIRSLKAMFFGHVHAVRQEWKNGYWQLSIC